MDQKNISSYDAHFTQLNSIRTSIDEMKEKGTIQLSELKAYLKAYKIVVSEDNRFELFGTNFLLTIELSTSDMKRGGYVVVYEERKNEFGINQRLKVEEYDFDHIGNRQISTSTFPHFFGAIIKYSKKERIPLV